MAHNRRIKSKREKAKLVPVPHNNRKQTSARAGRQQIVEMIDPDYPKENRPAELPHLWFDGVKWCPVKIKRSIFHMNLTPFEQRRLHIIKKAVAENDLEVRKTLNLRERRIFDNMIKLKELKEKQDAEGQEPNQS
jgi:hypothetical protein